MYLQVDSRKRPHFGVPLAVSPDDAVELDQRSATYRSLPSERQIDDDRSACFQISATHHGDSSVGRASLHVDGLELVSDLGPHVWWRVFGGAIPSLLPWRPWQQPETRLPGPVVCSLVA